MFVAVGSDTDEARYLGTIAWERIGTAVVATSVAALHLRPSGDSIGACTDVVAAEKRVTLCLCCPRVALAVDVVAGTSFLQFSVET